MSENAPSLRISDADREAAVSRLHAAASEGRLDLGELEERLSAAYAAKTQEDLAPLLADLPAPAGQDPARAARRSRRSERFRKRTAAFLIPNVVCLIIWLATDPGGSFWPVWVLMGTGIGYAVFLIQLLSGTSEDERPHPLPPPRPPSPPGP